MHLDSLSALEALRNALYKFNTYLLTYLLTKRDLSAKAKFLVNFVAVSVTL